MDIKKLARLGATLRMTELRQEMQELEAEFPEVFGGSDEQSSKPHWTQTPEGRLRMARIQRRAWKNRRRS